MKTFNDLQAIDIIKAAIGANAIRLEGNNTIVPEQAKKRAEADAAYLVMLFSQLTGADQKQ